MAHRCREQFVIVTEGKSWLLEWVVTGYIASSQDAEKNGHWLVVSSFSSLFCLGSLILKWCCPCSWGAFPFQLTKSLTNLPTVDSVKLTIDITTTICICVCGYIYVVCVHSFTYICTHTHDSCMKDKTQFKHIEKVKKHFFGGLQMSNKNMERRHHLPWKEYKSKPQWNATSCHGDGWGFSLSVKGEDV